MILQKKFDFCCSHKLINPKWSREKNLEIFGKCCNLHGHNYSLAVQIQGPVNKESGMVINFSELDDVVRKNVINHLDHKNLESDVPELKNKVLTVENIAVFIWNRINPRIKSPNKLKMVRVEETGNNAVEYYGNTH
ncbi:MAG: 6-carboxytetrahydropterin synthase [bacterium]